LSAVRMPHPLRDHPEAARTVRDAFWVLALGVIAAYAFFYALGAFSPGDVLGVTIAVGILLALWLLRVWSQAHHHETDEHRDTRLTHARERRGF
jgi:membrane protein implicated in regulation of membrane protease activity